MSNEARVALRNLKTGEIHVISSPLPLREWPFQAPAMDQILWRYGDYWKFRELFAEKKLYFRRADKLLDAKEGKFTDGNQAGHSELFAQAFKEIPLGDHRKILDIQESHRPRTFLMCWHKNTVENSRMWREYTKTNESVAIRTNVQSLAAVIGDRCRGFDVKYVGEDFAIPELHSVAPYAYKRMDFAFEQEFRLAYFLPLDESVYLDQPEDFQRWMVGDPARFVHELRFHPLACTTFKQEVRSELAGLGLNFPVVDSGTTA
jgi:hypothetical protein